MFSFLPMPLVVELLDVDQDRALLAQHRKRASRTPGRVPKPEAKRITPMRLPLQRIGVEARRHSRVLCLSASRVAGSAGIAAGDDGQQLGRVADARGHRPGGVLAVADRDDVGAADQPDRRLQARRCR